MSKSELLGRALTAYLQASEGLEPPKVPSAGDLVADLVGCEAVVAETCFLLARSGFDPALALQFIKRGMVQLPFPLQQQISAVRALFRRYEHVPASLAS